jgi:hypothetical protein
MKRSRHFTDRISVIYPEIPGRNSYQLGREWGCDPVEAYKRVEREGWFWTGYDNSGHERFLSPEEERSFRR